MSTEGYSNQNSILPAQRGPIESETLLPLEKWKVGLVFLEGSADSIQRNKKLPVNASSRAKRISVSRIQLLKCSRNETGAHFSQAITYEYLQLHNADHPFGLASVDADGLEINSVDNPEKFKTVGNYGGATIRAIAGEILASLYVQIDDAGVADIQYLKNLKL
ncbi:MAG: hypothetical protein ACI84R_000279 [Candidatus Azotimanducaceae bacterium]|jgi:hypothetical protein